MSNTPITILTVTLYLVAGLLFALRLWRKTAPDSPGKGRLIALGFCAVALHVIVLYQKLFTLAGVNFGFFNALSAVSWLVALMLLVTAVTKPVESLAVAVLPLAAAAILLELAFPAVHILEHGDRSLQLHVLLSVIAYSILTIAAIQAVFLAIQERHLHNRHPGGFIRALPPLQTMETLLFQMIAMGFVMQSLAIATGVMFLEDIFAQHLVHKTFLSILAWGVFATLLWGRWRFGWRGRVAIRWTLGGFLSLLLAYFGTKLVLEIVLGY